MFDISFRRFDLYGGAWLFAKSRFELGDRGLYVDLSPLLRISDDL